MGVGEIQMRRPRSLERRDAFVLTAHGLSTCGRGVCGCAVGQVSVCDVGPAGRRRLIQLVMQAQHGLASRGLGRPHALAERAGSRVAHIPRAKRAVAEEGRGPLIALLLEALRAHRAEEAVGGQRNMCSARGGRGTAGSQAACDAHAAAAARRCRLRPSSLAARVRGRNGRWARGRQRWLAHRAGHAQHAAARRAALLFDCRHGRKVVVVRVRVRVVAGILMTWQNGDGGVEKRREGAEARECEGRGSKVKGRRSEGGSDRKGRRAALRRGEGARGQQRALERL
jgi:hypothetical protein